MTDSNITKRIVALFLLAILLAGCSSDETGKKKSARGKNGHLVQVVEVEQGLLGQQLVYPARVAANLRVRIHNRVAGEIIKLPFYEGDEVEKGQLIAQLDNQLLEAALDKAVAEREQARIDVERLKKLVKRRAASADELTQAQTGLDVALANEKVLATQLGYSRLYSPIQGIISERLVEPGDILSEHTHLLSIIDPHSLIVLADIPERLITELKVGNPARVTIDALGNEEFDGKISRIYPALDEQSLNGKIEITLQPQPAGMRAGQFSRIRLEGLKKNRLLIPFPALQRDHQGEFVFRLKGNSVERAAVSAGARLGNLVEIKGDIKAGEKIVRRGFLKLRPGKTVKVVKDNISQ